MTENITAPAQTDAELRALWQQAGGTIYSTSQEIGSMPIRKLVPFLRQHVGRTAAVHAGLASMSETARETTDMAVDTTVTAVERAATNEEALARLVRAVCPGLDSGDLLVDAEKAIAAMGSAELVGHFGIDDEPCGDGSARYLQVGAQHAGDEDVFPLFRRAPRAEAAADAAPAPGLPAAKKASGAKKAAV